MCNAARKSYFYILYSLSGTAQSACGNMKLCQGSGKSYVLQRDGKFIKLFILAKLCQYCCLESTWSLKSFVFLDVLWN